MLVPYDPTWPAQAERLLARVRRAAGDRALSVEHVGSTAVPGLAAKDVLDVQVVTRDLATAGAVADDLRAAGLVRSPGEWWDERADGTRLPKAFAAGADPARAVDCHVRPVNGQEDAAIALRDLLRRDPAERDAYAALEAQLAAEPHASVDEYASRKGPWIAAALERVRTAR